MHECTILKQLDFGSCPGAAFLHDLSGWEQILKHYHNQILVAYRNDIIDAENDFSSKVKAFFKFLNTGIKAKSKAV